MKNFWCTVEILLVWVALGALSAACWVLVVSGLRRWAL